MWRKSLCEVMGQKAMPEEAWLTQWLCITKRVHLQRLLRRLAAIHAFVRYLQLEMLEQLLEFQRILAIPSKKTSHKTVEYLSPDALSADSLWLYYIPVHLPATAEIRWPMIPSAFSPSVSPDWSLLPFCNRSEEDGTCLGRKGLYWSWGSFVRGATRRNMKSNIQRNPWFSYGSRLRNHPAV